MELFTPDPEPRSSGDWVCGWASEGRPCRSGPSERGVCNTTHECAPILLDGHWHCGRPAALGGRCDGGPTAELQCSREVPACRPVPSARGRRRTVTLWLTLAGLGALAVILGSEARTRFISPGRLSQAHGSLGAECASCHEVAAGDGLAWLRAAIEPGSGQPNDKRCLACHDLGAHAGSPHGIEGAVLASTTTRIAAGASAERVDLSTAIFAATAPQEFGFACASCHQEHRGELADLSLMSNVSCQGCHTRSFTSLAAGHPEFAALAPRSDGKLRFEHRSHAARHFPERDQKFECLGCHQPDSGGRAMPSGGYARSCASCHEDQIAGRGRATSPGIAVLRIPGVDLSSLRGQRRGLAPWPEDADGESTPFLDLLLAADPDPSSVSDIDLLDLAGEDPTRLPIIDRWLDRVRDLYAQLAEGGHAELGRRLAAVHGRPLAEREVADLAGGLPPAVLRDARSRWLSLAVTSLSGARPESRVGGGGWYLDDNDFSIRYRPGRHADPFLVAWLELAHADGPRPRAEEPLRRIAEELSRENAPGMCGKCHVLPPPGAHKVAWSRPPAASTMPRLHRFAHAPHLLLTGDRGCAACHVSSTDATSSDFVPIGRPDCVSCHAPGKASDSCLLCHDYHLARRY